MSKPPEPTQPEPTPDAGSEAPVEDAPAEEAGAAEEPQANEPSEEEAPKGVDVFGEDVPETISVYDDREGDFSITAEELAALPPAAMHAVSNFRRAFLRKTQELAGQSKEVAEARAEIEAMKAELEDAKKTLMEGRAQFLAMFDDDRIKQFAQAPELADGADPPDRWTDEGQDHFMGKFFAEKMSEFLGGWQALSAEEAKKLEERRIELQQEQRKIELQGFIAEHDDFMDFIDDIRALREESSFTITAERAYEIAKAMRAAQAAPSEAEAARKRSRKAVGRPSQAGRKLTQVMPPDELRTAREREEWFAKHPEARQEILRRMRAGR